MPHVSDSAVQRSIEALALAALEASLPATFTPGAALPVPLGTKPDGVDLKRKIVVEVYARVGKLKSGQQHKVKGDLLKLAYIRQQLGADWRAILCFVDHVAAATTLGKGWHANAAKAFGLEVLVVDLPDEVRSSIQAAQVAQRMVNAREDD